MGFALYFTIITSLVHSDQATSAAAAAAAAAVLVLIALLPEIFALSTAHYNTTTIVGEGLRFKNRFLLCSTETTAKG